jgi:hypothetical protein
MAAYVLERARWHDRPDLIPAARPLKEEEVRQWLRTKDWRWYLDDEARAELNRLATGVRDVEKKKLLSKPDINIGDELLLIGLNKLGEPMGSRGPEWLYEIYRREQI